MITFQQFSEHAVILANLFDSVYSALFIGGLMYRCLSAHVVELGFSVEWRMIVIRVMKQWVAGSTGYLTVTYSITIRQICWGYFLGLFFCFHLGEAEIGRYMCCLCLKITKDWPSKATYPHLPLILRQESPFSTSFFFFFLLQRWLLYNDTELKWCINLKVSAWEAV